VQHEYAIIYPLVHAAALLDVRRKALQESAVVPTKRQCFIQELTDAWGQI
jgi:hypothetical protein